MSNAKLNAEKKGLITFRAGGRCEFEGCNEYLLKDDLTQIEFNNQQYAHIIADSPKGPRGQEDSSEHALDVNNIILLCPKHHHLVDTQPEKFSKEMLMEMKLKHEARVQYLLSLGVDKERTVVLYHANIGSAIINIPHKKAIEALWPDYYPSPEYIEIGMTNDFLTEGDHSFWDRQKEYLERLFKLKIVERIDSKNLEKMALFAIAPMPLLVLLGTLLSDKYDVLVYNKHREADTWKWQKGDFPNEFELRKPENVKGEPCLVFSISASIRYRIERQFPDASIWEITVPNPKLDYIQTELQMESFRNVVREAYADILKVSKSYVNVFMAMPNACAVEAGRVWMPKADRAMRLFDYNSSISELDRYVFTIENL